MGLIFLASSLLVGLAALGMPVLIHLISKRRARRVRFAAIEFVLKSQKRTARSVRLRQLVLLAVRTLFVAALALAIARPVWRDEPREQKTTAPLVVVLAVDVSASMHATLDGKSAFERSRQRAVSLVRELGDDVRLALLACGDRVRDLVATPTFDRRAVIGGLDQLRAGYHRSDLEACVARARDITRQVAGDGERRVVVFSDLAAHAFPGGAPTVDGQGLIVEWVPSFEEPPPPNHGLTRVALERVAGNAGEGVEVRFTAAQFGGVDVDVPADLYADGRSRARLILPLGPGRSLDRAFTHAIEAAPAPALPASIPGPGAAAAASTAGATELRLALSDDALAVDNEAMLPVDLPRPVRVLLIDGAPQPIPFRDEIFYLESALRQTKSSRARLSIEVMTPEQLTAGTLAGARVVALANVARVDDDAARALTEFVRAGGGLLVTMGDQVDVEWMNRALKDLLPGTLRGAKGQALLDDASVAEALSLTRFLTDHPLLRGLARGGDDLPGLMRVRTHTLMLLEPDASAPREVLARFSNEAPALLERQVDNGRVMLLATTVDRDWSDLAIRPGFLPLMQQLVLYLAGTLDDDGPRILTIGAPRRIPVPRGAQAVWITAPDGTRTKLDPSQLDPRTAAPDDGADVARDGDAMKEGHGAVVFSGTDLPGLYRVLVQKPGGEPREMVEERFSVLVDGAESDLTRATATALAAAVPSGAQVRGGELDDDDEALWPILFLLAVLLLVGEAVLVRRE